MTTPQAKRLGVLLYPDFELLDAFGPLEMFGNLTGAVDIVMVAEQRGLVKSAQGPAVHAEHGFADCPPLDLVLVPGGIGTRAAVDNRTVVEWLGTQADRVDIMMTVCTGSGLLAATGRLDGRRATTNKMFFAWPATTWPKVEWVKAARWVEDGKFVTSSGVSAGIDMALAVIARLVSPEMSDSLALATEYEWHRDAAWDPVARAHGLV